jgi:hypothetical protein
MSVPNLLSLILSSLQNLKMVSPFFDNSLSSEIQAIAAELEKVNNSKEITSEFDFDADDHPILSRFESSFNSLRNVLSRRAKVTSETSTPPQIHSPTDTPINSPERDDEQRDSPASTISNLSAKHEHPTDAFANFTVNAAYNSLKKRLTREVAWFKSESRATPEYAVSMLSLILSSEQHMKIKLGSIMVTAKSDGGISFHPKASAALGYPILCIEV